MRGHKCPGKFLLLMAEVGANPDSEIHADPTYYLEDKVNAEGDGNVMTEDKGGGRTKRVTVAPAWHKDFVMHLDNHHTYQLLALGLCCMCLAQVVVVAGIGDVVFDEDGAGVRKSR
ncbi:hypothetical protein Tco_1438941 [Tanacetum coccineum]